jgi:quercetin dioxygenase-like cupin family protein
VSAPPGKGPAGVARVQVLDSDAGAPLSIVASGGSAGAIVWPGMGAELRSLHRIELKPGGETVEMRHPSEAVYYVVRGGGQALDGSDGSSKPLGEGAMAHVEAGTPYRLQAGAAGVVLVGGPAPADPTLYGAGTVG